jgi:hypothetical protein
MTQFAKWHGSRSLIPIAALLIGADVGMGADDLSRSRCPDVTARMSGDGAMRATP